MWQMYSDYNEIWQKILSDITGAKESIKMEQYIFTDFEEGGIGRKFLDILVKKAKKGVQVQIIVDLIGSHTLFASKELEELKEAGALVFFHTVSTRRLHNIFKSFSREHRKLFIIDEKIAHIGGYIIQDRAHDWGELDVRFERNTITQEVMKDLLYAFDYGWNGLTKLNAFFITPPEKRGDFTVMGSSPRKSEHYILQEITKQIQNAKKTVQIASPYFVPTRKLYKEILKASRRGVEIEMILPVEIDNTIAKFSSHTYYKTLLEHGMKIYLYEKYIHAKFVIVDRKWCIFGSTNFDRMALLHNYEIGISTEREDFIQDLEKCYRSYSPKCTELNLKKWQRRPFLGKIFEVLSVIFWPLA
jgi:cardiolipin synthase A/B